MSSSETDFEVLLKGEFCSRASTWTEYLCLERREGLVILSSRGYGILVEASQFVVEDEEGEFRHVLPETIDGWDVVGIEDEYVVGGPLEVHDEESEIELKPGQTALALEWLEQHEWDTEEGFPQVWRRIEEALLQT